MKIILLDNYDSFTHNLLHLLKVAKPDAHVVVRRNSETTVLTEKIDMLVAGPGPCTPEETGILRQLFEKRILPEKIPFLGVCLGMQFLAYYFGAPVQRSLMPVHGDTCGVKHDGDNIFEGIPDRFRVARYNSLEVQPETLSETPLECIATEEDTGAVMALKHKTLPICGIQFHPESFLTENGLRVVHNFFRLYTTQKEQGFQ
jgi:anthranilate synthase/aminodeoxychorismate synthase-like glutamine amidotransferase